MPTVQRPAGQRRPRRPVLPALLGLAALLLSGARAAADSNLAVEMGELAKPIKQFLDGKKETAVSMGQFTCPPDLPSSSGPAIASALAGELKALGVDIKVRGTHFIVQGDYKFAEDASSKDGLHALVIEARVVTPQGEEVLGVDRTKPRGVYGDAAKMSLLGISAELPPAGSVKERDEKLKDAYENPKPHLDHTRVKAGNSPYSVEILVKEGDKYVPRPAVDEDGLAFVKLNKDDVYRVRVYNDSPYEASAMLSIDGLNMFCFSEIKDPHTGKPLYDRLLVPAGKSYDIPGWHRNDGNNGSNEFQVTKYADCEAAQQFPSSASVGTLTVAFAACWPKGATPPPDEPADPPGFSKSADLGTKRGAAVGNGYKPVERMFGVVRAAVSVRYSK